MQFFNKLWLHGLTSFFLTLKYPIPILRAKLLYDVFVLHSLFFFILTSYSKITFSQKDFKIINTFHLRVFRCYIVCSYLINVIVLWSQTFCPSFVCLWFFCLSVSLLIFVNYFAPWTVFPCFSIEKMKIRFHDILGNFPSDY